MSGRQTTCPYLDCSNGALPADAPICAICKRPVSRCPKCKEASRALARFCRSCGTRLGELGQPWSGLQGGPDRRGCRKRAFPFAVTSAELEELPGVGPAPGSGFHLQGACVSLLIYEGFLLAISEAGVVEARELMDLKLRATWRGAERLAAEPCVAGGLLYLASEKRLTVTPLAGLGQGFPVAARSEVALPGRPVEGLLALAQGKSDAVFVVVEEGAGRRLYRARSEHGFRLGPLEGLHAAAALSGPVASAALPGKILFLSEERGELLLHQADAFGPAPGQVPGERVERSLIGLRPGHPLASLGKHLFAVLGPQDELCRIDGESGHFGERMAKDVRSFAIAGPRDGVVVETGGIYFPARHLSESVEGSIRGAPILWHDFGVVLAKADGRVAVHDIVTPASFVEARVAEQAGAAVTALAVWEDLLAAGAEDGNVKVFRLVGRRK